MWRKWCTGGVVVVVMTVAPAFAQTERKPLQVFNDVSAAVLRMPTFTIFDDVAADVSDGTVILTGKVTMPFKKQDIEKRVANIDGVRAVVNRITILPVSQFDEELRFRISRAIYGNASFWHYASMANPPIHIVVERGHVLLTGVVNSNVERMQARSLASSFGAFSVKSDLKTDAEMKELLEKIGTE